jgi:acetyl-CoA carboxylase biotin carboxylase subunit
MNTRLQVEHPITELVTGVDLVEWQIRIARGEPLTVDPHVALTPRGHAVECRVYAEDPDAGFLPSPGRISGLRTPSGPGIRNDSGVEAGAEIPIFYDPLISKLAAWGDDRRQAIARMRRALHEYEVVGIRTTLPFFRWVLAQPEFEAARFDTTSLDRLLKSRQGEPFHPAGEADEDVAAVAAALYSALRTASSALRGPQAESGTPHAALRPTQAVATGWKLRGRAEGLRS